MRKTRLEMNALDDERREIEKRIHLRARKRRGLVLSSEEWALLQGHTIEEDSMRYIKIQNEWWEWLGLTHHTNEHQSVPG